MTRAEFVELAGAGVAGIGVWLLTVGLFGVSSAWSVFTAGLLLVLWGIAIVASANTHTAIARPPSPPSGASGFEAGDV
jgi:hypothetical protein